MVVIDCWFDFGKRVVLWIPLDVLREVLADRLRIHQVGTHLRGYIGVVVFGYEVML